MLTQYLKQCCLVINPGNHTSATTSAIHTVTAGLELSKMVIVHSAAAGESWKKRDYTVQVIPADAYHLIWKEAYEAAFNQGFRKVILLHAAPVGLSQQQLEEAFLSLRILEVCMGPLKEGGLYLTGMHSFHPEILENSRLEAVPQWKTFQKSVGAIKAALYKTALLPG